jgi:outer membrane receptor for ferrienterochelin and colicin
VRLESYLESGDNFTISGFYKRFKNHIEMGFGNVGITWENIKDSRILGIELEGKKRITDQLEWRTNVTFIQSQSQFIRRDFRLVDGRKYYEPIDTLYRPMYGQAPYLVNTMLTYRSDSLGLTATLSYNVQGPRLVITGTIKGMPDVYEIQRHLLDFKISKEFGQHFIASLTVRDILNAPVRRAYKLPSGWFDYDNFRYGTNYLLSFTYRL